MFDFVNIEDHPPICIMRKDFKSHSATRINHVTQKSGTRTRHEADKAEKYAETLIAEDKS